MERHLEMMDLDWTSLDFSQHFDVHFRKDKAYVDQAALLKAERPCFVIVQGNGEDLPILEKTASKCLKPKNRWISLDIGSTMPKNMTF